MASTKDILATLYYLRRDNLWQYVKPYSLEFETDEIPRSNFKTQKVEDIPIEDVRGKEDKFSFSKKGWAVLEMESAMTYEDFQDSDKIDNIYCHELSLLILEYMKPMMASSVQIFDTAIRRRHSSFPYGPVDPTVLNQPAVRVHVAGIVSLIESLNGDNAEALLKGRYMYLNVWKPLKGPVHEWPLALCDADSVSPSDDFVANDTVFSADVVRENVMVHFNATHRWHYLSDQMPSELLVFRQVDSELGPAVPHTSFINPTSVPEQSSFARESIEARVLVFFEERKVETS